MLQRIVCSDVGSEDVSHDVPHDPRSVMDASHRHDITYDGWFHQLKHSKRIALSWAESGARSARLHLVSNGEMTTSLPPTRAATHTAHIQFN